MSIKEAFFETCEEAKPAKGSYVSLYVRVPFYGGPEEGGWWGADLFIVAYKWYATEEAAEAAAEKVRELAAEKTAEAKRANDECCAREMEWLEARNLDADFLPEVDGPESYLVMFEDTPGKHESRGCRHYE